MGEWDVRYLGSRLQATGTKTFSFERPPDLSYKPGQFFYVMLKEGLRGVPSEHHFSFSSSPTEPNVEFTTRLTGSPYKNRIDEMAEGEIVHIAGPDGVFVLQPDARKVCHLCGGIGITPARSTVRWALDTNADLDLVVLHANRDLASSPFREEFESIDSDRIRVVNVLSEPEPDWIGPTGVIAELLMRRQVPDFAERDFYVSGPAPMVDSVVRMLSSELQVQDRNIFSEHFPGYAGGGG